MSHLPSARDEDADRVNPFMPVADRPLPAVTVLVCFVLVASIVVAFIVGAGLLIGRDGFGVFSVIAALVMRAPALAIFLVMIAWLVKPRISK